MSARLLVVLPVAALLAACTSSGKGPSSSAAVPHGMPTGVHELSELVTSAARDVTSAHLQLGLNLSAAQLAGTGDEKLSSGEAAQLDLTANLAGAGAIRVIYDFGHTYAKLPTSMNPHGKPYLLVTPNSSNATIRQLAPYIRAALAAVSPGTLGLVAAAAPAAEIQGTQTIDGEVATHYALQVDTAKLTSLLGSELVADAKSLPLDLYVTGAGRVVKADLGLTVQGVNVPIDVKFSDYNAPVSISAPPADQIGS